VVSRRITQSGVEFLKRFEFIPCFCGGTEKLPQAFGGEEEVLDLISHPDAEGFPTTSGTISVGTEDASGAHRFSKLVLGTVPAQEAVLDEIAHGLAMRTLGHFELGIELVELELRRTNLTAHQTLF